ncbi:MAG: EscU/YscU/HrcU family type III secretion system export apparatus switch protein [Nitrospinae bacterium]|nr:EscU/YscU/HrcU family type III secretion system export apparatus switch protein [Nitrospinota bacterium]
MTVKKEKPKKAVALKYEKEKDRAPRVAAKGRGEVAKRIMEIAKEHNIPIREDADLVEVLSKLDLEEEIPPHLYRVIAEVLSFIYRINSGNSSAKP